MKNSWSTFLLIGSGGFLGSIARYCMSILGQRYSLDWPIGTMTTNVLGCLAIGLITELSARGETIPPEVRLALVVGFCGGFTTMSSMIYETSEMLRTNEYLHAVIYSIGTVLLCMTAFILGSFVLRIIFKFWG